MKRILVSLILVMGALIMKAQPSAGHLFVGANLGIYGSTDKTKVGGTTTVDENQFTMNFLPMAGFFLSDKIAVGARLGVSTNLTKYPDANPDKRTSVSLVIEPFARYYLISGTGGIFAQASAGITSGTQKYYYDTYTNDYTSISFSLGVSPGVYYYITPHIAVEGMFGWIGFKASTSDNGTSKDISNNFGLNLDSSSLSFGFTYTF
jgi:outer membrane protein